MNICPFTGGGDFYIEKLGQLTRSGRLVIHLKDEADCTDSPLGVGEYRGPSNLVLKSVTSKSQPDIDSQLRANMLLSATHSFYSALWETPPLHIEACLAKTKKITCLGITFGVHSMIVVYKLIIDFENNTLQFEELFRHPDAPSYAHLINCALSYVVRRVSTWTVEDETDED